MTRSVQTFFFEPRTIFVEPRNHDGFGLVVTGPKLGYEARMTTNLVFALLLLFGGSPRAECIKRRLPEITTRLEAAETTYGVPRGLLLAVGFLESHLGCAPGSGGCWGAPVSRNARGTAGTSDHAARALARSREVCGTWLGAVSRFRCGLCRCPRLVGYEPGYAVELAERTYARAGLAGPDLR